LWALRDELDIKGPKFGCGVAQCGACTVLLNGEPVRSCSYPVSAAAGQQVITIEGLASKGKLHPVQQAFLTEDAFQCGYCTPGQICSAVGLLAEVAAGQPSEATADLDGPVTLTDAEIRERMSGNICRCSAYPQILAAVRRAAGAAA
jgi:xanthine dehydrogenase YagT iron-sulfur-binding subunit